MGKGEIACNQQFLLFPQCFQETCTADIKKPGLVWERVKHFFQLYFSHISLQSMYPTMLRSPVEATFFLPLTSTEACEKRGRWLWKAKLCYYWCEKARKHMCVTDHHDMKLAVTVVLNPNTTNQTTQPCFPKALFSLSQYTPIVRWGYTEIIQDCFHEKINYIHISAALPYSTWTNMA